MIAICTAFQQQQWEENSNQRSFNLDPWSLFSETGLFFTFGKMLLVSLGAMQSIIALKEPKKNEEDEEEKEEEE